MIAIIPRMKFTISSRKTPEEVRLALEAETAIRDGLFHVTPDGTDFVGEVMESGFRVMPRLPAGFKDSFLPVIRGQIQVWGNRTEVDIRMRLAWFVYAFCVVWFGITGLCLLFSVVNLLMGQPDGWKATAGTAGMFLFGQLLVRGGFYIPARRAKRRLEELFGDEGKDDD